MSNKEYSHNASSEKPSCVEKTRLIVNSRIGFMQGRLSEMVEGRIQAFPWNHWQEEFEIAFKHDFGVMEWTLDQDSLYKNPLMTDAGRQRIKHLQSHHNIRIPSLTGDCLMQVPFFKTTGTYRNELLVNLRNIIQSCVLLDIEIIVFPLVDNARLENDEQSNILKDALNSITPELRQTHVKICFESDLAPEKMADFMEEYDSACFGVNYDIGNSASLGYRPSDEICLYGHRIMNVHIKDRLLNGTTVPLGKGNANIPEVLECLEKAGYQGNYILQTARAPDSDHIGVLEIYRKQVLEWSRLVGV